MDAFALSGFLRRKPSGTVTVIGSPFQKEKETFAFHLPFGIAH